MRMGFLLIAVLLFVAWRLARPILRKRAALNAPDDLPRCGRCHYIVRGLPGLYCPECGGDLREVGILRAPTKPTKLLDGQVLLWTLFALVLALLINSNAFPLLPQPVRLTYHAQFDLPQSKAYQRVLITASDAPGTLPNRSLILQTTTGQKLSLDLNASTTAYSYTAPDGQLIRAPSGFGPPVILAWMKAGGIDTTLANLDAEAAEIAAAADAPAPSLSPASTTGSSAFSRLFSRSTATWSAQYARNPLTHRLSTTALILLWLAGLLWIYRKRKA